MLAVAWTTGRRPVLARKKNERLVRVGPGTPMGEFARRFWIPFLTASELSEADGAPRRVRLLGEDLVAFRQTDGRVGLLDAHCPHRKARLFFGRNEECGLRCIYHGWKFDADGDCVDVPNVPDGNRLRRKVRITSYPVREIGGCLFAYMGPRDAMPPEPHLPWRRAQENAAPGEIFGAVMRIEGKGNYLQHIENLVDDSHLSWLHAGVGDESSPLGALQGVSFDDLHPVADPVCSTATGVLAGFTRTNPDGSLNVRANAFSLPFTTDVMNPPPLKMGTWQTIVPIDDHNHMFFGGAYSTDGPLDFEALGPMAKEMAIEFEPGTARLKRNSDNDYLIDREMQRTRSFSGIVGIRAQDCAIAEIQGPGGTIADRSIEYLCASDKAVIELRKRILKAIDDFETTGVAQEAGTIAELEFRGADFDIAADADTEKACLHRMQRKL